MAPAVDPLERLRKLARADDALDATGRVVSPVTALVTAAVEIGSSDDGVRVEAVAILHVIAAEHNEEVVRDAAEAAAATLLRTTD